jgi:hypothetical protein
MRRLFDRIPDATLNKVGRRYNLFCMFFLAPYVLCIFGVVLAHALGWAVPAWDRVQVVLQVGWVVLWLPNLLLIGIRADRDYRSLGESMAEFHKTLAAADAEFTKAHAVRMAWAKGHSFPEDDAAPPTLQ